MSCAVFEFIRASGAFVEPESYHLVRFDGEEPAFAIVLHDVPRRNYERSEFGIGVDAAANRSLLQRGDLDPNGRMAWNWQVGYKFVLLEGQLLRGDASDPLVYHIGFDENYRPVSTELRRDPLDDRPPADRLPGRSPAPLPECQEHRQWYYPTDGPFT